MVKRTWLKLNCDKRWTICSHGTLNINYYEIRKVKGGQPSYNEKYYLYIDKDKRFYKYNAVISMLEEISILYYLKPL